MAKEGEEVGNKNSADSPSPATASILQHRRIRAPKQNGATIHIPPLEHVESTWANNLATQPAHQTDWTPKLLELKKNGRNEIVEEAFSYSRQHRDIDFDHRDLTKIVMAGHQPTLFHPGVWYKNFLLSELGDRFNAAAINLVVDNDNCGSANIYVPTTDDSKTKLRPIALDLPDAQLPFEERKIQDRSTLDSFAARAKQAIAPIVEQPIVSELWAEVINNVSDELLGHAIARGRHAFESKLGLSTLEIPVSHLARSHSFAQFSELILGRIEEFIEIYNRVVETYRKLNKIRSYSHPVPQLKISDGWIEAPFWIWSVANPVRKSLFVKPSPTDIQISNLADFTETIPKNSFADNFHSIQQTGARIRPKALMTTLYSRLVLSDLFIHGIGGAKYDQLTDAICNEFFEVILPIYQTTTATMLIQNSVPPINRTETTLRHDRLRQMKFHPEAFIDPMDSGASKWLDNKSKWLQKDLPIGNRLQRHQEIAKSNEALRKRIADQVLKTQSQIEQLRINEPTATILNSREFSFCLFDSNLPNRLKNAAKL